MGTYGGEKSPGDISRGVFAGEVGMPRLNRLLERYDLTPPGSGPVTRSKTFPEQFEPRCQGGTRSACTATAMRIRSP